MELNQYLSGYVNLKEVKAPRYHEVKLDQLDELRVGKIFLSAQTLMLAKAAIRERMVGALDNYEINDHRLINNLPIKIHGESFSARSLVDACLNNNKSVIVGFTDFVRDCIIMSRLAIPLKAIGDIDCKFTREILRLLNTRSDINIFRELKLDDNLYIYFLNNEYMVLTNRGLVAPTSKTAMICPSTTQEFFVSVFKLGSLFESLMTKSGFRGTRVKPLQIGKLTTYASTIREKYVDTDMVFNSYMGTDGRMHWFFNDGYHKRKDRLVINFNQADRYSNFSMCNQEWVRLKTAFGFPEFNKSFLKQFQTLRGN